MPSGFRLLVYAIITLIIIVLVHQIMGPLLFPLPDNLTLIERSLKASETGLGKSFTSETFFQKGEGFSNDTFNQRNRNVSFQCINPVLCCPRTEECPTFAIEWDYDEVKFNEDRAVNVTTRCKLLDQMYGCDVYIGAVPGQLEIDEVSGQKELDLSSGSEMYFDVAYSNTGKQEAENAKIEIRVFQRYYKAEKWEEKLVEHASKAVEVGSLSPNASGEERIFINLNQNGTFRAEIKIGSENGGFDVKSFEFEAFGAVSDCEANYCENPVFVEGKCTARCHCKNCLLASRCAELLKQAGGVNLHLNPGIEVKDGEADILGSNNVNMILEDSMCPSDIVIEEPNAVGNLVGFEVKNEGDNPVQKRFEVKAYLGEDAIGSVEVLPEEMKSSGFVIKTIEVSLPQGKHEVKLVANGGLVAEEDRKELEDDYTNNEDALTVEITKAEEIDLNPGQTGRCCGFPMEVVYHVDPTDSGTVESLASLLESKKIRAEFVSQFPEVKFRIQNMSNKRLKVLVPTGQVFIPKVQHMQNVANTASFVVELPVCKIYVGEFQSACLNRLKTVPSGPLFVGRVLEDEIVLDALGSSSQNRVWNAVSMATGHTSSYGHTANPVESEAIDPMAGVDLTPQECIEAGFFDMDQCKIRIDPIYDPDTPDEYNFYCD